MEKYKDKNWLIEQYWTYEKSLSVMAKEAGVCASLIRKYMIKLGVKRRTISESNSGKYNGAFVGGEIENYNWVKARIDARKSIRDIAKEAGVSLRTSARWIEIHKLKPNGERKQLKGHDNPRWTGKKVCKCGNKKTYSSKLCGKCHSFKLKKNKGELSATWKGIADIKVLVRGRVMPEWRRLVFERDDYKCVRCGDKKGGNLHAHHIKRFSVIVDNLIKSRRDLDINNVEDRLKIVDFICVDQEINSVENGATLCESCHTDVHKGSFKDVVKI